MATYYLVTDYLIPVYIEHEGSLGITNCKPDERRQYFAEQGLKLPKNYIIARLAPKTSVRVVFFEIDHGLFLIEAPNQPTAYRVLRALDGFFYLYNGEAPSLDRSIPKLNELKRMPNSNWTRDKLIEELRERNTEISPTNVYEFHSGWVVPQYDIRLLGPGLEAIYPNVYLVEALSHLGYSRYLFYGYMVGSYYHCHYKHDRSELSHHQMQKKYFENRERYELSFVSAFKGIERILKVGQIRKHEINDRLVDLGIPDIRPETTYRRWHETFSGLKKDISYSDIIEHFLDIRNVVAAHANPSPPDHFLISEDSLIEVQLFLSELCQRVLGNIEPRKLPKGVVQPFSRGEY